MHELPPDVERLRVLRTYLQLQLAAVDAALVAAEHGVEAWATGPAVAWKLQHLPAPAGQPGRGVLHRADCWIQGIAELNRDEARVALEDGVEPCAICKPTVGLKDG